MIINNYYDIELNELNKISNVSSKINVKLKPHQLTALNKAIEMEFLLVVPNKVAHDL
jgi:hypothetical protein